jgi:cytochrome c biogenesis protein CcmG/thiol:disulfide interchange protein DsbE
MEYHPEEVTPARRLHPAVILIAFAVLVGFLIFIGLGLRRAQAGPILVGQPVPDFELTTFDGRTVNTADWDGKVLVLNFWASWCKPCEQEAADLQEAWKLYEPSGDVLFLGIDWVDTEPEAKGYLEKFGITYPNGPDLGTKVAQMFRTTGVPETYFIDREGNLAYVKKGPFLTLDEITTVIDDIAAR